MTLALQFLGAYLLGAIPFAYLAGKLLRGIDIREHGSGNVGATNVFRVLGKGPGVLVLSADIFKGFLATWMLPRLAPGGTASWAPCLLGLAAVLGHSFTVFLRFKGGKGVATSAGAMLGLAPFAMLGVFTAFFLLFGLTRMVSAGSLAGSGVLAPGVWYFGEAGNAAGTPAWSGPVFWLGVALTLVIWIRHIPNIRRILNGTESRFGKPQAEAGGKA